MRSRPWAARASIAFLSWPANASVQAGWETAPPASFCRDGSVRTSHADKPSEHASNNGTTKFTRTFIPLLPRRNAADQVLLRSPVFGDRADRSHGRSEPHLPSRSDRGRRSPQDGATGRCAGAEDRQEICEPSGRVRRGFSHQPSNRQRRVTEAGLEACAILALLKGRRAGSRVAGVVGNAAVRVFNQAEVVSHFVHLGAPLEDVRAMLGTPPYTVVPADEALVWGQAHFGLRPARSAYRLENASASRRRSALACRPTPPIARGRKLPLPSAPKW